jgi:hypothetical protein
MWLDPAPGEVEVALQWMGRGEEHGSRKGTQPRLRAQ